MALEAQFETDSAQFAAALTTLLKANGYTLTADTEDTMSKYFDSIKTALGIGITKAAATGAQQSMQSQTVLKLAEDSFKQTWPDGLNLSDRLWKWDKATRDGVSQVLQDGIRTGKGVDKVVMEMQLAIERAAGGERFKIVTEHVDDWVKELYEAGSALIHDPSAKAEWDAVVANAREIIDGLKTTGSRAAAERVFNQLTKAVGKGNEAAMDAAVKWWTYDKQLYNLKRIARTEMANAGHRAVIESTINVPSVIGYKWQLSAGHPVTDICDFYASIDMGLGKGVFTKEAVPRSKAHPHCMCLLIPTVLGVQEPGSKTYAEWLGKLSEQQRKDVLPNWAAKAIKDGTPLQDLVRKDGFGLITQDEFTA